MKYSNKIFSFIAMVICLSLCMGIVSHAETTVKYEEKNYGSVVDGLMGVGGHSALRINSHGKLEVNLMDYKISKDEKRKLYAQKKLPKKKYKSYAHVTFNSKGKKTVNAIYDVYRKPWDKYIYENRVYGIYNKKTLVVHSRTGKVLKKIKPDLSKYLKKGEKRSSEIKIAEIAGKNKIRLFYHRISPKTIESFDGGRGYGGIIEVNTKTGKIKKIVSTDNYVPRYYDGKYIYGFKRVSKKITFFRTSLKTQKTESFTADAILVDRIKYLEDDAWYAFYNGCIMGFDPAGKVYYGTFNSKKFEQVGDISECKNFKEYYPLGFAMKNKNEFYIMYDTSAPAHMDPDGMRWNFFVVKYQNK